MKQLLIGLGFILLWSSASVATKFGITEVPPFLLATVRFLGAGLLMLGFGYGLASQRHKLPRGKEWLHLLLFGLLNTTVYLGAFVWALREVPAGIGSLAVATNPLFIAILSSLWLKRPIKWAELLGIFLGLAGITVAALPVLQQQSSSLAGLLILLAGMLSVSIATVYYTSVKWKLAPLIVNGWQVLLGGLCLIPATLATTDWTAVHWTPRFWGAELWLIFAVSICALQLWFYLVRRDPVQAALWLFLSPLFGFAYAALLLHEHLTYYTLAGTLLVISGLYLAQRWKKRDVQA
ncbi:MAG TPA: EamA family transporter [Flavisolibacter sp.]|jgi:drug/metabolite transporter (DMT)-like permease|nr:EamA family transporter [Flavisolibacter sp.]